MVPWDRSHSWRRLRKCSFPPAVQVFTCYWSTVPVYVVAQLLGAAGAAALTMPLYGFGPWVAGTPAAAAEVRVSAQTLVPRSSTQARPFATCRENVLI